jgi:DNA-binding MarR family transcriptional regulator/GNAT superfamily N-acetyltransferase
MDAASIRQVRSFNRTVTERVGALNERFLGRPRPLGESRLIWEVGAEGAEIRELRARLSLDSGYLSRLLRSLERQGLLVVETSGRDRRVRCARLTNAGAGERAELDRRADVLARGVLDPLNEGQRVKLLSAMSEVERLLNASLVEITVEDPRTGDARWCFEQYFAELDERFAAGFDPSISIPADATELTSPSGLLLLARMRGRPVGCGALKLHPGAPAELKRMWVARDTRGLGVGRRLLVELEGHALAAGATVLHLETNRALTEARNLYRRSGFVEVAAFNHEPYADHWFEKVLRPAPENSVSAQWPPEPSPLR